MLNLVPKEEFVRLCSEYIRDTFVLETSVDDKLNIKVLARGVIITVQNVFMNKFVHPDIEDLYCYSSIVEKELNVQLVNILVSVIGDLVGYKPKFVS